MEISMWILSIFWLLIFTVVLLIANFIISIISLNRRFTGGPDTQPPPIPPLPDN